MYQESKDSTDMTLGFSSHHNSWSLLASSHPSAGGRRRFCTLDSPSQALHFGVSNPVFELWVLHLMLCTLDSPLQACHLFSCCLIPGWSSPESGTFPVDTFKSWETCLHTGPFGLSFWCFPGSIPPCCHSPQCGKPLFTYSLDCYLFIN